MGVGVRRRRRCSERTREGRGSAPPVSGSGGETAAEQLISDRLDDLAARGVPVRMR